MESQKEYQFKTLDERMNFKGLFPLWENIQLNIGNFFPCK